MAMRKNAQFAAKRNGEGARRIDRNSELWSGTIFDQGTMRQESSGIYSKAIFPIGRPVHDRKIARVLRRHSVTSIAV
jgi:hypothetical protein